MRRDPSDTDIYCPQAALVDEELARKTERRLARYRAKYEAEKLYQKQRIEKMALLQRQQRMWMAGGALVVVGLGWMWYKRHGKGGGGRSGRRGRGSEGGLPRDLLLDEDDGFNGTDEELLQVFDEAAKVARKFPNGMLDERDQLMLYGLYKQAMEGDRNIDAPSKINVVAHAKYDSWGKFKGLPKRFAMKKYCEVVYHFSAEGDSSYDGNDAGGNDGADDVVYDDDDDDEKGVDLDEDGCPIRENNADGDYSDNDFGGIMMSGMGAARPSTLLSGVGGQPDYSAIPLSETGSAPEIRLRNAAMSNDAKALSEVVVEGACDLDDADDMGQTALHFAADRGSADCLRLLVDAGAGVNAVDCDGIGVLQTALSAGLDAESVRVLLEAGADPDAVDEDGDSPRSWVAEEGDEAVVELFAEFPSR